MHVRCWSRALCGCGPVMLCTWCWGGCALSALMMCRLHDVSGTLPSCVGGCYPMDGGAWFIGAHGGVPCVMRAAADLSRVVSPLPAVHYVHDMFMCWGATVQGWWCADCRMLFQLVCWCHLVGVCGGVRLMRAGCFSVGILWDLDVRCSWLVAGSRVFLIYASWFLTCGPGVVRCVLMRAGHDCRVTYQGTCKCLHCFPQFVHLNLCWAFG